MRSIPFLLLALVTTGSAVGPPDPRAAIRAVPVALDPTDPARRGIGALRFIGGWELTSARPEFGGISAIHVRAGDVTALSDTGWLFRFTIGGGRIGDPRYQRLAGGPGDPERKTDRDSESLAIDPRSGRAWVAFERHNAIWRYGPAFGRAEAHAAPDGMTGWPWNGGPESLVRLNDGRFLLICEDPDGEGLHEALLFSGDPTDPTARPIRFRYRATDPFRVTDATLLPDGRLMILHRDFALSRGVRAEVAIADPGAIRPGGVLAGRVIARLAAPLTLDNMEAISAEREGGKTIIWLASDDNFSPLQRTLLMKFELQEARR